MQQALDVSDSQMTFSLVENDSNEGWVLCCTLTMIPTHEDFRCVEIAFDERL